MNTFRYHGEVIRYTNPSSSVALAVNSIVVISSGATGIIGIVVDTINPLEEGALAVEGVHELAALITDTGSIGARMYWDVTNTRLTTTATGNTFAGYLAEPKLNGDLTAHIKLTELVNKAPAAALTNTSLTDSTGGTGSATLAAITAGASYAQADMVAVKNAIASLAAQVNDLTTKLRAAGTIG